ncbi:hypothetical protein [Malaciobacter marinus]|uniref:hypothetical protein n=1 Tax=Malaciobacter marinus TaxID=505249 RepID=UPI003B00B39C
MNKKEMKELFGEDLEFLKTNENLKNLLDNLCPNRAKYLMQKANKQTFLRFLENEKYFDTLRDFERELYPLLVDRDTSIWKKLANDKTLSIQARLRSAYLYTYLSKKPLKLDFDIEKYKDQFSFYHGNRSKDGDGYASMFGLKNGLNNMRFNQFKSTGGF